MKKLFYSFVAMLTMSLGANAEEAVPTQIHILGAGASTINGTQGSWDISSAVTVDVVDGTATVNIDNAVGAYHIFTCSIEDAVTGGWGADSPLNTTRIAAPSTLIADFGMIQNVIANDNTNFNENSENCGNGNVTMIFSDNLTKVTILPTTLFCVGDSKTKVNGSVLPWDFAASVQVKAENGVFTLSTEWESALYVSPWNSGDMWGKGVIGEGYVTTPRATVPADKLNQELTATINGTNPTPPFLSTTPYTIIISQDLKTIEYEVAQREFQIEVREGLYGEDPLVYDMKTTDGVTYTHTFSDTVPAGKVISILNKNDYTDTVWRRNGNITFDTEENWETKSGATPSTLTESFIGTITAIMPTMMVELSSDWGNKYWSATPNAKVTFTKNTSTGIEAITADNDAPVEYFNLQGVRVVNPENGLFIRRQGSKISKIIK